VKLVAKFAVAVSLIPVAILPPMSLIPVVHLDLRREFSKKFETVLMGYSVAGGKLIYEKKPEAPEAKNLVTLSL
jgi:hypothetical protein